MSKAKAQPNPAGYPGTPLPKNLGIKENSRVLLVSAPSSIEGLLCDHLPGATLMCRAGRVPANITPLFVTSRAGLERRAVPLAAEMLSAGTDAAGVLWICWPKNPRG